MNMSSKSYYARLDSFSRDYLLQEYSLKEIVQSVVRTQANYFIQKIAILN